MIKKYKSYLILAFLIILALFLLFNKLIIAGLIVIGAGLLIFGIQQLIDLNVRVTQFQGNIDALGEKNDELLKQNLRLKEENSYLKERHFRITQIRSILELNLFEIETCFKRSLNKEETVDGRKIRYFGTLNVSLTAKYGIDCRELRFKYDAENDNLSVANINPKFLSFGNRKLEWDFFEILEYKNILPLTVRKWMVSENLSGYAGKIKEEYRLDTEKSLEKGPEEFAWIHDPVKNNVESLIKILFSGLCRNIQIVDKADDTFIEIDKLSLNDISGQRSLSEQIER